MRWTTNRGQSDYMRGRARQNRARHIAAEDWAAVRLAQTGHRWSRQAIWGCRIFDFWCHQLGCAVEIDDASHDRGFDASRDAYNAARSAIIVLRVQKFDEAAMQTALSKIAELQAWNIRRTNAGLRRPTKRERREGLKQAGLPLAHGRWAPPLI